MSPPSISSTTAQADETISILSPEAYRLAHNPGLLEPLHIHSYALVRDIRYHPPAEDGDDEPPYNYSSTVPPGLDWSDLEHARAYHAQTLYWTAPPFHSHATARPFRFPDPDCMLVERVHAVTRNGPLDREFITNLYAPDSRAHIDHYTFALHQLQYDPSLYGPHAVMNPSFNPGHSSIPARYRKIWHTTSCPYAGLDMNKAAAIAYTEDGFRILAVIDEYLGHDDQIALFAASVRNMYRNDFVFITIPTSLCIPYRSRVATTRSISCDLLWAMKNPRFPSLTTSPTAYAIARRINADQDGFLKTYLSGEESVVSVFTSLVPVPIYDSVSSFFNIRSLPTTLRRLSSYVLSSLPSPRIPSLRTQPSIDEESLREEIV